MSQPLLLKRSPEMKTLFSESVLDPPQGFHDIFLRASNVETHMTAAGWTEADAGIEDDFRFVDHFFFQRAVTQSISRKVEPNQISAFGIIILIFGR